MDGPLPSAPPSHEALSLEPLLQGLPIAVAGAAIVFILIIVLYFLLRGPRQY